jgi:hypothetical protein
MKRTKRRILTAGAGVVAFTAFEGLACGNPVAPSYEAPRDEPTVTPTTSTTAPSATAPTNGQTPPSVAPQSSTSKDVPAVTSRL